MWRQLLSDAMHDMDGVETCRRIKVLETSSRFPIIVVTARNQKDFWEAAIGAGASDTARKGRARAQAQT